MQKKLLSTLLIAAAVSGARAQDASVATPSSPAPVVQQPAPMVQTQVAPTPNQVIYSPRLPTAAELTSVAAAQGQTIDQINQTATQVTVIYRNASGATNTVAYQLLPNGTAPASATTTVVAPAPAPTVIYQSAPQVIYYDSDYYRPRYYYNPPVSVHLGFGYSSYRGGWRGHHHHYRRHW